MTILDQLAARGIQTTGLCADSRAVRPGDVFVAMPGYRSDGRSYIADAVRRGAAAVLYEPGIETDVAVPAIEVPDLAALSGDIAHLVFGRPSEQLWMAGVTGTNGKTSVSQWIAQAMNLFDCPCAVIGTLGNGFPNKLAESANTTPDAITLHRLLAGFVEHGAVACAMEVSSIGLDQNRIAGADFDVAVFTNLTRDHLEYHGTMEAYGAAKAKLFDWPGLGAAVVNLDDPFGAELDARLAGRVRTIGYTLTGKVSRGETLAAQDFAMTATGIAFTLNGVRVEAPVVGRFNASNLLAVIGALLAGEETLEDIAGVLPRLTFPPGRMQAVGGEDAPLVVIDYAHTPDALEKALGALRETAMARGGRLACVFGCGGERDPGKRPMMGAVAERLADRILLTSDNPRDEDPAAILAGIAAGMQARPEIEPDRARAIEIAIAAADSCDVILLAGKGHERYQEIVGVRHPFSDLEHARAALERRR
ncbi:MAG: UDP-N-acetylmuramoyl-L-alanyl-D-glutamate--2,6-diaminopimelate ligase [Gammaproteobacteria bacterium]|nr:UDP-N-acetylmuramoyl-L-alanyl-D-glutamate--2,6-diaminopimelate ligase [Gammaproteobacteria bacterium]MBU1415664.1 UDP-N-acetylmuramoyl-L-alanyl-D-glutamate--2,6-diaminopimelate ligase [Gammaproteobacteria bacterium]